MSTDRLAEGAQSASLSVFALSLFLAPAGLAATLALFWVLFLLRPAPSGCWRDPAVLLILGLALYALLRGGLGIWLDGTAVAQDWSAVGDWLQLAVVIPFAVLLGGNIARLRQLLLLALIGLLLGMLIRLDWAGLLSDPGHWLGSREDFGFTAIAFGLYSGAALLGVMLLRWPAGRWMSGARWGAGLLLGQGLLLTQSRGAWLAFVAALAIGLGLRWRAAGRAPKLVLSRSTWLGGLILLLLLGLNGGLVTNRLAQEADSATALLQPGGTPDAQSSLGLRWQAQHFGLALWLERPWLGWGAGTSEPLIAAQAQSAGLIDADHPLVHLHNSYLELLVQFGLPGLLLFLALIVVLFKGLIDAQRSGHLPADLAQLLLALLVLTLVWSLFNFRMLSQDWRGFWTLVVGAALSVRLRVPPLPPQPQRILLVRLSAIGDLVFASPLIDSFRAAYPRAYLAWLVQPGCAPLLRAHPGLDAVIEWPQPRLRALLAQGQWRALIQALSAQRHRLHARRFDLAVDVQGLLKSALPTRLSGASQRIGLDSREGSGWLMTQVIRTPSPDPRIGSEYRVLAEALKLPLGDFAMRVEPGETARAQAEAMIAQAGLHAGFALLCPFTTRAQKHWFEDRWIDLARQLRQPPDEGGLGLPVRMLGAPADRKAAARLAQAAGEPLDIWVGATSLPLAMALIERARLVIGVDTGLSHMGLAARRPTVLLFGATRPYLDTGRPEARVLYHPRACSPCRRRPSCNGRFDCMGDIESEQVLAAARSALAVWAKKS